MTEKLFNADYSNFFFVNRTKYKAEILAEKFNGRAFSIEDLNNVLSLSDVVFTSTGADDFIINSTIAEHLIEANSLPMLIVDMAIPRDVDKISVVEHTKYFDIGDLKHYLKRQDQHRQDAVPDAEKIILDQFNLFKAWSDLRSDSILEPYSEDFERIRTQILEEYKSHFSDQDFKKVEKISKSLIHRMQSTFIKTLIRTNQEIKVLKQHRDSM